MSVTADHRLTEALRAWLPQQRWFGGGQPDEVIVDAALALGGGPDWPSCASVYVLTAAMPGGERRRLQAPLGFRPVGRTPAGTETITVLDGIACYDATTDPAVMTELVRRTGAGGAVGDLRFVPEPGNSVAADAGCPVRPIGVEQSNTSVVYDDRLIFKLFRRLHPGLNPDAEVHRRLTRAGCRQVAPLVGTVDTVLDGEPVTLAVLQEFAADAVDGWAMAQASVRESLADPAEEVEMAGGDLSAEMFRLGAAVASAHRALATAFEIGPPDPTGIAGRMIERFDRTAVLVPELGRRRAEFREVVEEAAYAAVDSSTQRVHGDLHLGQVLRTSTGWLLIDFEGEPGRPIVERIALDLPVRDLAGMVRSLDYAAERHLADLPCGSADPGAADRVRAWAAANRRAFLAGYGDPGPEPLLRAYELDKAVYELGYELRHRPSWAEVPLRAVAQILDGDT
ncbi:phosphotransferase [Kutzneria kofuensis]|uniref:Maltokinase n=1 Tax=Kutzneria kofuensis TaxID=103725 RepID=A0A7W9KQT6_9PSEU|nr:phosphotransferase [Kutzneria kofuensis]MBB5896999.1 maltokinase [Kutzneria kofuensis]